MVMNRLGTVTLEGGAPRKVRFGVTGPHDGRIAPRGPETEDLLIEIFNCDDPALLEEEGTGWRAYIHVLKLPAIRFFAARPAVSTGARTEIQEILEAGSA